MKRLRWDDPFWLDLDEIEPDHLEVEAGVDAQPAVRWRVVTPPHLLVTRAWADVRSRPTKRAINRRLRRRLREALDWAGEPGVLL